MISAGKYLANHMSILSALVVLAALASFSSGNVVMAAQKCVEPPPDMTSWWPGDGNTDDIIGGRNATLQGDTTTGKGLVKKAFVLDGDGDFVNVPHDLALNVGTGDFTVDLWVLFNNTEGEQILVEKWIQSFGDPNTTVGWSLTKIEGNALVLAMSEGLDFEIDVVSDVLTIPTGTWIHFAATRQGDLVTLYMNGVSVAEGISSMNLDSESSLKFGHRGDPVDTPGSDDESGFYLNGRIDEVELFIGRALTADEIKSIYDAGSAGKCKMDKDED